MKLPNNLEKMNYYQYNLIFSAAESYFDVALAEADPEILFDIKTWPVCLPKFASEDVNLR